MIINPDIISINCGWYHSSALTSDGRVFMWGSNSNGQLGIGKTSGISSLQLEITNNFPLIKDDKITKLFLGGNKSSAISFSGRVFVWGYKAFEIMVNSDLEDSNLPIEISSIFKLEKDDKIVELYLNHYLNIALSSKGRVFLWGKLYYGNSFLSFPFEITSWFPLKDDEKIYLISLGLTFFSVLTTSGRIFMWGENRCGQLGDSTFNSHFKPIEITNNFLLNEGDQIISICTTRNSCMALSMDGKVFLWGLYGIDFEMSAGDWIIGTGPHETITKEYYWYNPHDLTSATALHEDERIMRIYSGEYHFSLLSSKRRIFMFGQNNYGQLGLGKERVFFEINGPFEIKNNLLEAYLITFADKFSDISLGWDFSLARTLNGKIFSWGQNHSGQLGQFRNTSNIYSPTLMEFQKADGLY